MRIKIANRLIGDGEPCFIIAEAGVNHNGDVNLAKKLVDAAKLSGVDAIKFQTFKAKDLVTKYTDMASYQEKNIGKRECQQKMLKKLELSYDDFRELKKYCDKKGVIFLSTPHTENAAEFLEPLIPAYKIASGDLTNLPFLEKIAKKNKPIILATGMATLKEVSEAVNTILPFNKQLILLHCTTNYPTPIEEVNLRAMITMKKFGLLVGYSDHTMGINVAIAAVALGACIIEKHFTLDKNMKGPDHKASLEPQELSQMINDIRDTEQQLKAGVRRENIIKKLSVRRAVGSGVKKPTKAELEIMKVARKSIVASRIIGPGTVITENMLIIKRPGTGIKPKYIYKIIGKKVKERIKKDELITWNKIQK